MKQMLNVLYVSTPGAYLGKDGECVSVRRDGQSPQRVPIAALEGIICLGRVSASPYLMAFCAEKSVALTFLTETGRFLASVHGETRGNVLLRRWQYRWADDPERSAQVARSVLKGKIANARTVLRRGARESRDPTLAARLGEAADIQTAALTRLDRERDVDGLRGVEGDAAHTYWSSFGALILNDNPAFCFTGRNRRPPRDAVNALLSFVYVLLAHDCRAALEGVGLDAFVGFLHRDRPGRASLALDLEEELRSILADRLVLSLINRRQVDANGFQTLDTGAVVMNEATRKTVITAWQERKRETIQHPFLKEDAEIGLLPHLQSLLLARHIRGDLDLYPPLIWA